jgi:hypothetical protein
MLFLQKKWGALRPLVLLSLLAFTTANPHPFELTPSYFPGFSITQNQFPPRISQEVAPTTKGIKSTNEGWKLPGSFPGFTIQQNLGNKEIFPPPQITQEGLLRIEDAFPGFTIAQNMRNSQEIFASQHQQKQIIPELEQDARNKGAHTPTPMEGAFYFPTEQQSVKQNLDYFPGFTLG